MDTRKALDQSAAVQDTRYVTTIYLDGYQYTRAGISGRKTYYRCSYYRTGCRGKVDLVTRTKKFVNFSEHSCGRRDETVIANPTRSDPDQNVTNTAQPSGFVPPPIHPRANSNQVDPILLGRIETPPLSLVRHSTLPFFQFNCATVVHHDPNKTPNRVIGWAHPQLLELLKHNGSTIYVDSSLQRLPPCFEKCLILVVHDHTSGFFVPAFYVLSTTRTGINYRNALHWVVQATKEKLRPNEIVCDFDNDLISALKVQFPNAIVKGSAHLFKKNCWNSMEDLDISEEAINVAMEKGVLDMLLSIPPDRVASAGIAWVKQQIKNKCAGAGIPYAQNKWRSFWVFFKRFWISQFPPSVWNLHGLTNSVIARTNNPLEHFQRELADAFTSTDPGLQFFVATIEKLARRHVADLAAETTTLPSAVEVFSELEDSDKGENSGTESDRSTEI